jgi:hypothetical protein
VAVGHLELAVVVGIAAAVLEAAPVLAVVRAPLVALVVGLDLTVE